jgi:hypothetical protein
MVRFGGDAGSPNGNTNPDTEIEITLWEEDSHSYTNPDSGLATGHPAADPYVTASGADGADDEYPATVHHWKHTNGHEHVYSFLSNPDVSSLSATCFAEPHCTERQLAYSAWTFTLDRQRAEAG